MTVRSAYEKMLENPANRVSTSGMMKQPMPNESGMAGADMSNVPGKDSGDPLNAEEAAYLSTVDAGMARRATAPMNENYTSSNLEKRVKDIEGLLVEVMKTHMELIKRLGD